MKTGVFWKGNKSLQLLLGFLILLTGPFAYSQAQAFTLRVVGSDGGTVSGFRWLLEEDTTNVTVPGVPARVTISTDIHNSYAPVVAEGQVVGGNNTDITLDASGSTLDASKRYFITVLPDSGYALGGTVVEANPQGDVIVTVNFLPLPTAQISLFAFVDHNPVNNILDTNEQGLGGATVIVDDTGGQMMQDAFGNPLGTQYDLSDPSNPTVTQMGTGIITTLTQEDFDDPDPTKNPYNLKVGEALIKYLVPGKYGVRVVPPEFADDGSPMTWSQTSTIEGTPTVDAWVKANEPKLFVEGFGTGFNHVFYGFVKVSSATSVSKGQTFNTLEWNQSPPTATGTITGTLRMNHFSRPPELQGFFPGVPVPNGWVGINDPLVRPGLLLGEAGKYAAPCNEDGSFTIENVPPGTYQLVTWDTYLDTLFGFHTVTVPPGASGTGETVVLGNVLVFRWFGTLENYVFYDEDGDGYRDPGEPGIPEQGVNLRFRDGTIYQAFPTDLDGYVPFDEVFPFFKWLVVEVDFARFKATGMTTAVDYGGDIRDGGITNRLDWPWDGNKVPQPQAEINPNTGDNLSRTEQGEVLTQAMHLFLGQTNLIEWGKGNYGPGENGGISGIVYYAITRAEDDPRYAAGEEWEPGIPRVQVNLYADADCDGVIDDLDVDGSQTLADVDNYPFQWAPMYEFLEDGSPNPEYTGTHGSEDTDRNYVGQVPGAFDPGDAIQITTTDSWDDNKPRGCIQLDAFGNPDLPVLPGLGPINECADGFGTWNQVRPGLFDGGYAFGSYYAGGMVNNLDANRSLIAANEIEGIPMDHYIVEAVPPPGYALLKEEDKNVDFGEIFIPSPLLLPPICVGESRIVPPKLSFDGETDAPYAGESRPLCNMKQVPLSVGQNAAADFFFFTQVPKAARAVGFVNNDLAAEFNQASPIYGEKLAAAWIPVSFRDWAGNELVRVYTDEFGGYNALLPSTYTVNVPSPRGVSPNMITLILNDPFKADGTPDPFYDPDYAVTPWTFNYMPGATSYLDTPIVPVTAFTANEVRLDTGPADHTPVIYSVTAGSQAGPLICTNIDSGDGTVTITSPPGGEIQVRNPDYPALSLDPFVILDVGFGPPPGTGSVTLDGVPLTVTSWTNTQIQATVPEGSDTGRIMVTRNNGLTSEIGVTLTITDCSDITVYEVSPGPVGSSPVQDAIDLADAGDIILVGTGQFNENVIMYKPVRLQGSGVGSFINGNPTPAERLDDWHVRVDDLGAQPFIDFINMDPFTAAEAPGILVIGKTEHPVTEFVDETSLTTFLNEGNPFTVPGEAAIDGFTISGSKAGGGIYAISGAVGLMISNNNITGNQGTYAGGIAVGVPTSGVAQIPAEGFGPHNANITIRHNKIHRNGGVQGAGGIALNEGTDDYLVEDNLIIGNFGRFNGGGIQHLGLSLGNNVIAKNRILFNENFFGALLAQAGDGAGIYIGGNVAGGTGSGSVTVDGNLIQGNLTGSGNGGGIRAFAMNADDVRLAPANPGSWYTLEVFNNMIVNNVAGLAGAGISLQDVARATIVNNTIAHNDSTATSALAFQAGQANSTPQPAGIASAVHSDILQGLFDPGLDEKTYSDPVLVNNIIWENRSFFNDAALNGGAGGLAVNPNDPNNPNWDLHVIGSTGPSDPHMNPNFCILTSITNPATDFNYTSTGTNLIVVDPEFTTAYFNSLESTTVLDEGGNAINVRFTPLNASAGNYHIEPGPVVDTGSNAPSFPELDMDFDGETRPFGSDVDIGADEFTGAVLAGVSTGTTLPRSGSATEVAGGSGGGGGCFIGTAGKAWGVPFGIFLLLGVLSVAAMAATVSSTALAKIKRYGLFALALAMVAVMMPTVPASAKIQFILPAGGDWLDENDQVVPERADATRYGLDVDSDGNYDNIYVHMAAGDGFVNMADRPAPGVRGRLQYMFGFANVTHVLDDMVMMEAMVSATFPAPTITVKEGQKLYLTLSNVGMVQRPDLFDPHTIHWHGFPNAASIFDGVPSASISVNMMASLTYFYNVVEPGTYMWHCHVEATEHMQMGMLGNLYVTPQQDELPAETDLNGFVHKTGFQYAYNDGDGSTYYDVDYPIQIAAFDPDFHDASMNTQPLPFALMVDRYPMLNGRGYPDTVNTDPEDFNNTADEVGWDSSKSQRMHTLITAKQGEKILLRISSLSTTSFHTLTVLGIPMKVVGKGSRILRGPGGTNLYYDTNSVNLGGGEAVDVILDTAQVEPGTYFLYSTNLDHLSNDKEDFGGMMTEIVITTP